MLFPTPSQVEQIRFEQVRPGPASELPAVEASTPPSPGAHWVSSQQLPLPQVPKQQMSDGWGAQAVSPAVHASLTQEPAVGPGAVVQMNPAPNSTQHSASPRQPPHSLGVVCPQSGRPGSVQSALVRQ